MSYKPNIKRDFGELKSISLMICSFITTNLNLLVIENFSLLMIFLFRRSVFIDSSFWNKILSFDEKTISDFLIGQLQPFWGFHLSTQKPSYPIKSVAVYVCDKLRMLIVQYWSGLGIFRKKKVVPPKDYVVIL